MKKHLSFFRKNVIFVYDVEECWYKSDSALTCRHFAKINLLYLKNLLHGIAPTFVQNRSMTSLCRYSLSIYQYLSEYLSSGYVQDWCTCWKINLLYLKKLLHGIAPTFAQNRSMTSLCRSINSSVNAFLRAGLLRDRLRKAVWRQKRLP